MSPWRNGSTRSNPANEIRYTGAVRGPCGPRLHEMSYAIITLGGKQYRVQEGERLLVDRLAADEGKTFSPRVLLVGGDGNTDLSPSTAVTARVVGHVLGDKIRIGKYRRRTGYRRHNGHRSRLTQIEIETIAAEREPTERKATPAGATAEEAPARTSHPPKGYEELTVAQIADAAAGWRRPNLEAALEYEQAHAKRKGAIAALEAALAAKEETG
jgi:large subunit ribosomal protein L21